MLPENVTELLERPLGLLGYFWSSLNLKQIPAGHELDSKRIADRTQVNIPRAEKNHGFIATIEGEIPGHGRIRHFIIRSC